MSNELRVILTIAFLVIIAKVCSGCASDIHEIPVNDLEGSIEVPDGAAGDELAELGVEIATAHASIDAGELGDAELLVDAGELGDAEVLEDAGELGDAEVLVDSGELGDAEVLADAGELGDAELFVDSGELRDAEVLEDAGELGDAQVSNCDIAGSWHLTVLLDVLCFNSNEGFEITIDDQEAICPVSLSRDLSLTDSNLGTFEGVITFDLDLADNGQLNGTAQASGIVDNPTFGTMNCATQGTAIATKI